MRHFQKAFNPLTIQRFYVPSLAEPRLRCTMGRQMELRHLRSFLAVAEALNFADAAARLGVAQPALRRQVLDLEDDLGVDLLKRNALGVQLTADGMLFLEDARDMLKLANSKVSGGRTTDTPGQNATQKALPRVRRPK